MCPVSLYDLCLLLWRINRASANLFGEPQVGCVRNWILTSWFWTSLHMEAVSFLSFLSFFKQIALRILQRIVKSKGQERDHNFKWIFSPCRPSRKPVEVTNEGSLHYIAKGVLQGLPGLWELSRSFLWVDELGNNLQWVLSCRMWHTLAHKGLENSKEG